MLLLALDILLNIVHSGLVLFLLFGVFYKKTATWHFFTIMAVWASWLLLGIYTGHIGYCPLTDWHWHIKMMRGETHLPPSFIEYVYTKITGNDVSTFVMEAVTVSVTLALTAISTVKYIKWRAS